MVFSMRIVNSDFYIATPIPDLDVCDSTFRETATSRMPVIRMYGATPGGQKTCLHVHGVFPYIYVPYDGTQPTDKYMKQFAVSVDFAVQVSLGKASSSRQHVYEISVVKGIPFYGYHEGERDFLKISLYNPFLVTRVVSLLQNGAVMNKVFQPHEAHIPYLLQFFMDFNLYGMNLLHVSAAKFRNPVRLVDGSAEAVNHPAETQRAMSPPTFAGTPNQMWNKDTVPREWILGSEVERVSFCELEVDVLASDILNKLEIRVNLGTNPGLAAIWEDEQQRRRDANESSQISAPSSQSRGLIQDTETERKFKERIKEIIDERDLLVQSQMGKLGRGELSPQELASFQDSICSLAASQKGLVLDDSLDTDAMSQLLSQHAQGMPGEGTPAQSSQVVVDEDEPVVNQSIVQEVVEASQAPMSQQLSSSMDKEMINILVGLAEESPEPGSQRSAINQSVMLEQGDSLSDEEAKDDEDLSEAEESIIMSQRVWDDIEHQSPGSREEQVSDEQGNGEASQRASQFDLEGMSDTWVGSFLEGDIPQLDGAADEDSDGQDEFRKTRKRLGMGRTKRGSKRLISASKTLDVPARNELPSRVRVHSEASQRTEKHGESKSEMVSEGSDFSEENKRSVGEDIWLQKGRAIRTYSKRSMSSLKLKRSPRVTEQKAQNNEKKEETVEVDTEKDKKLDYDDTFTLFLSESSGSEDNTSGINSGPKESELSSTEQNRKLQASTVRKGSNFGSERVAIVTMQELGVERTFTASNERRTSLDHFPVITKYFDSPEKDVKQNKKQTGDKQRSSSSEPSTSCKTLGVLPIKRAVPSTSSSHQTFFRGITLRKRKLSGMEKKERKRSKEERAGEHKQNSDLAASLSVISGAMSNLRVTLEDVSKSQMVISKFEEARARLRSKGATSCQSYTRIVNQDLCSPVAKGRPSPKRSPIVTKTKEGSLSFKRTSPKRREDRMKKYGMLPVVITKSPTKSPADNKVLTSSPASRQIGVDSLIRTSQIYREPALSTDVPSCEVGDVVTGSSSSRSRTRISFHGNKDHFQRLTEHSSSETPSIACSGGDETTSRNRTGSGPSRQVSLKLAIRSGDKPRILSLQRKGLKRKLRVDFQEQQTPALDLLGSGKKRKLSVRLKTSALSFLRTVDVRETLVTRGEEFLVKEGECACTDQYNTSSSYEIQQTGLETLSDGTRCGRFDSNEESALGRSLLDDITCVPSSPGEPDSSDEACSKRSNSTSAVMDSDSLLNLTKACPSYNKSPDITNSYVSAEDELKTTVNVSRELKNMKLLPHEGDFPKEKDTELLANALFNMSFSSPVPCEGECDSPPCPSSPLEIYCDDLNENQVLTLSTSNVEERNASEVEEANKSSAFSFLTQVQPSQSSPAVHSALEGYSALSRCPELGETQSQGTSSSTEVNTYVGQKTSGKETTADGESIQSHRSLVIRGDLSVNEEEFFMEESAIEGNNNSGTKAITSEKYSCGSEMNVDGSKSIESLAEVPDPESLITPPLKPEMSDLPDFGEDGEPSISSTEQSDFFLKLSTEEESSNDMQLSVQGNLEDNGMEMSLHEGKDSQVEEASSKCLASSLSVAIPIAESTSECKCSCGSEIVDGSKSIESLADVMDPESLITPPLKPEMSDLPDFGEDGEPSISSAEQSEFVLKLSTEEENSNDKQLSMQGNLENNGMEMSLQEGKDSQVEEASSKCLPSSLAVAIPITESTSECKNQTLNTNVSVSVVLPEDGSCGNYVVIKPLKGPPSSNELLSSLKEYGLAQCKYQEPFCSNADDIPALPKEIGGRILKIDSKEVSGLPEFESSGSSQGLKHWRMVMSSACEYTVQRICQTMDDATNVGKNAELKIALMGDGLVVVRPCRGPPSSETVKTWARGKLAKRKIKHRKKGKDLAPEKLEQMNEPLKDQVSGRREMSVKASKVTTGEQGRPKSSPQDTKGTIPEVTSKVSSQSLVAHAEVHLDRSEAAVVSVEADRQNIMALSDSSSPVEITSPCSLFSPDEGKIFTFASGTHSGVGLRKGLDQSEIIETQPMGMACRDGSTQRLKFPVTSAACSVTVTPSIFRSPEQTPASTQQPLSPLLQTQNAMFPGPHHSTPVATKLVYGVQSPRCTPISNATTQGKRLDIKFETSGKKSAVNQVSTEQTSSLRQQLLASQFKFITPGAPPRRSMPWSSQIEGPSPNNTYGFKIPQMNLQDAKALHEVQHLTLFSLELHVRTRRNVRPDPEFDPICAIFYYIQTDTPLPSGKNKVTGILCVDSESAKTCTSGTDTKEKSLSNIEDTSKRSPIKDVVASTSTSNMSLSRTSQDTGVRPLLWRSGVTDCEVQYVAEEKDLFPALLVIIRKWDPDILIGYEVQMFSWGFLLERALTFEIDLCSGLSRVKGSSSDSNMDAEKDRWGAAHTSEIKIAGRIILNVWRLMRHEVTLSSYSFENVAFHVLHERIPLFSYRTLSDWWDHRTALNRWRTVDHYIRRCRGNVRILESVDFIGRTSELARLFGILFFSVISRGSQYRVESMMLRIAKPMNYIPVSPSVEQRGAMRAPETIPLVMEPESRFYSDPVLVLDFQSLYPTMIIAYNYCFSTCLGRVSCLSEYGDFKFGATSLRVPPSLLKKLDGDIHVSPNGVAFVKPSVRRGILPSMLDEILQTRIMVKASMKKWKNDKSLGRMLDARQLGLKLIANVTFGYTSAHFSGRMPCVEIGDSIVRKARETLERAIDLVNNTPRWGARVVYGDTDSLFVLLKGVTKEEAFRIGKDIVDTVTALNPKPVKLKFEKVYLPCVLQTKKRYVGYMYETLDQKEPVFDAKGIETVRRDSCPAVAKILEKSLRTLFETRDLSLVKKYVQRQCSKLMEGRASIQDFTFAKEYRGMKNYKPGACVPALELTRRMLREDRRSEPRVGERVPYVVVYGSPGLPLIQLVRRPHEVLQDPSLRLNASYYITKQILPPLNRVFSLIGMDVFTWYAELPRVVRVAQMPTDTGDKKKGTISQYFATMTCPVCQELTPVDLCSKCRAKPQLSAVTLMNRMRGWERTHQHLSEICFSCCGSRDSKLCCVSLDCPVFYKLVQCTRDLSSSQHLRKIMESF